MKFRTITIALSGILFLLLHSLSAVSQNPPDRSVADFIDDDGHFQNPEGYSGILQSKV